MWKIARAEITSNELEDLLRDNWEPLTALVMNGRLIVVLRKFKGTPQPTTVKT
jgi:hypothetical protein